MNILEHLEPKAVFHYFESICAIPHGSGNTRVISDYLVSFAQERGLEYSQDSLNNVIIIKDATSGCEDAPAVILQGHMDMVCEKTPERQIDMTKEGLRLAVDEDTVYAEGTTLGGDDGIAVAMILAVLDGAVQTHPRIEAVFTVDEEIGMLGAAGLDVSPLRGRRMINIDSEVEGVFTVSCAGGRLVRCLLPGYREPFHGTPLRLMVSGLTGGHSGTEIHHGRANANILLGRLLAAIDDRTALRIDALFGGEKDNAIPVAAHADVVLENVEVAAEVCHDLEEVFRTEYAVTDPELRVTLQPGEPGMPLNASASRRAITLLRTIPDGVQTMSPDMPGLVQTSLNLGILQTTATGVEASFCVRSSLDSQKEELTGRLRRLLGELGGGIEVSGDYPGWGYQKESPLRELMTEVFMEQYGKPPVIDAVHAGVECGIFAGKLPGLDCVSIGPDLTDIHTVRERLHIASTKRLWALLAESLRRLGAQKR